MTDNQMYEYPFSIALEDDTTLLLEDEIQQIPPILQLRVNITLNLVHLMPQHLLMIRQYQLIHMQIM